MLVIGGLGMSKEHITIGLIEECRYAHKIFIETYTSYWNGSKDDIENIVGKRIFSVDRSFVEEKIVDIVKKSEGKKIVLLVPGDPLFATTHIAIVNEIRNSGIDVKILHAPSVINAIARCGISIYNIGKIVSIPKFAEEYKVESFYKQLVQNLKIGLHTLILIDPEMKVREALEFLKKIDEKRKKIFKRRKIIICSKLCYRNEIIAYSNIKTFLKMKFDQPTCIIVPGGLNFYEKENINEFKIGPARI